MTQPNADYEKLGRYLSGELTPAESGEVERWLADNASEAKAIAALAAATRSIPASRSIDTEAALRKVKSRLAPKRSFAPYVAWAAAAAIVLAVGYVVTRPRAESGVRSTEYATRVGSRDSMTLADGSRVILGPASRMVVRGREVDLTAGEAFFVVVHNAEKPFTVRAAGTVITDIGTEFSVHSDHGAEVRVVVREGSVQMQRQADSVVLSKGDVGTLGAEGKVTASRGAATEDDLAWTTGKLVFRDALMSEVSADLRRWYGVEIKVTDSAMLKRHFTGSFSSEPPARVLDAIALALKARVDRRGDTVFIRPASPSR